MPGKSPSSSWISRFKKRVSSHFTSDPPASSRGRPRSPELDVPHRHADVHLTALSASHPAPTSDVSDYSSLDLRHDRPSPSPQPSTTQFDHSACQNCSSAQLLPPSEHQLPQGQASGCYESKHTFGGAHHFVMNHPVLNDYSTTADNFMKELLQETIIGAEFDSSDRHPPPRCHPGTRLAIIQRCLDFITQCNDIGKLFWIVGRAGVGKSAVMQMVTETVPDGVIFASVFLSINGRTNGSKIIITVAYQLAVKCASYRQYIRDQVSLDPSLLRKSLPVHFKKLIVEPFMHTSMHSGRFLVVIDGLDECDNRSTQRELLGLITNFCLTCPTSPLVWIVASRPEPHITSFFDNPEVQSAYIKEEMAIDSDEACEDVQRYLRDELKKIKLEHPTLRYKREWPLEHEFTTIASAAGGLFAYAATVVRYIGDPNRGDPAAQLRRVLETIEASARDHVAGRDHPMDRLDELYKRILFNVPHDVMVSTRKLLLISSRILLNELAFRGWCNGLGLTEDDAYGAICHLHAVMKIPKPDKADDEQLSYYHKSFEDFLSDFKRSSFSGDFYSESLQLCVQITSRVLDEVPYESNNLASSEDISVAVGGWVKSRCDNISLSWPGDERFGMSDEVLRVKLYGATMDWIQRNFGHINVIYESISCFHALTTRIIVPRKSFPFYRLRYCAFEQFSDEFVKLGKLKEVPLRTLDYAAVCGTIELQWTSPTGGSMKVLDTWNPSCKHNKKQLYHSAQQPGYSTEFQRYNQVDSGAEDDEDANIPQFHSVALQQPHKKWCESERSRSSASVACIHCSRCLARCFMKNPDLPAKVFVDSTSMCYVEFSFIDPDDGVSEWRYHFLHSGPPNISDM